MITELMYLQYYSGAINQTFSVSDKKKEKKRLNGKCWKLFIIMMEKNPEEKIHLLILLSRDSAFTIMTSYPQIKTLTDCLQIASALMPPVCTRQILFQNKKKHHFKHPPLRNFARNGKNVMDNFDAS